MNIYWSHQEQKLVPSLNSEAAITRYDFVLRDTLPVVLRVVNWQAVNNVPYIVTAIDAGKSIKFGAKASASYATDTEFLFSQATWTAAGSGITTTYSANIPLNTAALIAKMGTATSLDCKAEFTILNATNGNELSTQVTFRIIRDVISGDEGVPSSEYDVVAQYTSDLGVGSVRLVNSDGVAVGVFRNGCPYVFETTTALWYPLTATLQDGIVIPAFGAGEEL